MEEVLNGKLRARPARTAVPARVHRVIERALRTEPAARYPRDGGRCSTRSRPPRGPRVAGARPVGNRRRGDRRDRRADADARRRGARAAAPRSSLDRPSEPRSPRPAPLVDLGVGAPRLVVLVAPFANQTGDARLDDTLDVALQNVLYRSTRVDPVAGVELADREARTGAGRAASIDDVVGQVTASGRSAIVVRGTVATDPRRRLRDRHRGPAAPRGVPVQLDAHGHAARADGALAAAEELGAVLRLALGDPPPIGSLDHVLSRSPRRRAPVRDRHAARGARRQRGARPARTGAAITADPGFVEAHAALGLALYNLGRLAEAGRELEIAARDSDHMPERQRLGLLGDFDGTVGRYEEGRRGLRAAAREVAPATGAPRSTSRRPRSTGGSFPLALELARRAVADHGTFARHPTRTSCSRTSRTASSTTRSATATPCSSPSPTRPRSACASSRWPTRSAASPTPARAIYARLAETEPELADGGRADLAIFEGKPELAEPLLAKLGGRARRQAPGRRRRHRAARARAAPAAARRSRGRRGPRSRSRSRSRRPALARPTSPRASPSTPASGRGLAEKARAWRDRDSRDWRMFGEMLDGDLALAAGRPPDAIAAYQRAGRIGRVWLQRARLGRAYLAAHQPADAARELAWCRDHRGEAAIFMTPSLALLPPVEALARSRAPCQIGRAGLLAAPDEPAAASCA